jgi:hypothetical protein
MNMCQWLRAALLCAAWTSLSSCGGGGGSSGVGVGVGADPEPGPGSDPSTSSFAVLMWDASTDISVIGYRVYYGAASHEYAQIPGEGVDAGMATTFVVHGLERRKRWHFAVTAYDAAGNESQYSEEASKLFE